MRGRWPRSRRGTFCWAGTDGSGRCADPYWARLWRAPVRGWAATAAASAAIPPTARGGAERPPAGGRLARLGGGAVRGVGHRRSVRGRAPGEGGHGKAAPGPAPPGDRRMAAGGGGVQQPGPAAPRQVPYSRAVLSRGAGRRRPAGPSAKAARTFSPRRSAGRRPAAPGPAARPPAGRPPVCAPDHAVVLRDGLADHAHGHLRGYERTPATLRTPAPAPDAPPRPDGHTNAAVPFARVPRAGGARTWRASGHRPEGVVAVRSGPPAGGAVPRPWCARKGHGPCLRREVRALQGRWGTARPVVDCVHVVTGL